MPRVEQLTLCRWHGCDSIDYHCSHSMQSPAHTLPHFSLSFLTSLRSTHAALPKSPCVEIKANAGTSEANAATSKAEVAPLDQRLHTQQRPTSYANHALSLHASSLKYASLSNFYLRLPLTLFSMDTEKTPPSSESPSAHLM